MENIKIQMILRNGEDISFIEFIEDGKSKILSLTNFIARFGISEEDIKRWK